MRAVPVAEGASPAAIGQPLLRFFLFAGVIGQPSHVLDGGAPRTISDAIEDGQGGPGTQADGGGERPGRS